MDDMPWRVFGFGGRPKKNGYEYDNWTIYDPRRRRDVGKVLTEMAHPDTIPILDTDHLKVRLLKKNGRLHVYVHDEIVQ